MFYLQYFIMQIDKYCLYLHRRNKSPTQKRCKMEKQDIKKILIIRFRQIGDSILAAAMCSSLKRSFPNAQIHIVLNERISPIFHNHPDIDKIISFTPKENEKFFLYLGKIWNVMRAEKYDVIIDMRSTIRTLIFSLFSLGTPIRIGKKKKYTNSGTVSQILCYTLRIQIDELKKNIYIYIKHLVSNRSN